MSQTTKRFRTKRFRKTQKQKQKQNGGEQLPISHFTNAFKTQEEYDAMTLSNKSFYEDNVVFGLLHKVQHELYKEDITREDKVYYIIMLIQVIHQLFIKISKNAVLRNSIKEWINDMYNSTPLKELGTPEIFTNRDIIKQYIEDIESLSLERINSIIDENNAKRLRYLCDIPELRKLFKENPSIGKKMFYGSDEMLQLLSKNLVPLIFSNDRILLIVYLIDILHNIDDFKRRMNMVSLFSSQERLESVILYLMSNPTQENNKKLLYLLQTRLFKEVYRFRPTTIAKEYASILSEYILLQEDVINNNYLYILWIEWIYNNLDIDKTKKAIDNLIRLHNNSSNYIADLLEMFSLIDNNELYTYTVLKLINTPALSFGDFKLLFESIIQNKNIECLTALLKLGLHTNAIIDEGIEVAKEEGSSEIEELLKSYRKPENMWKGWSRSDISKFDLIFSDEGVENYSICPVCLKYVQRTDGCLYMSHNCSELEGFYHERLYKMYAWNPDENENENENGGNNFNQDENRGNIGGLLEGGRQKGGSSKRITWCTTCGRICFGHRHYKLGPAESGKPEKYPHGIDPFEKDCRITNYGGGFPEKVARYRRAREYALELQEEIGKLTEVKALEELVEQMWNAPFSKTRKVNRIIAEKTWNIPSERFPVHMPNRDANNANSLNIPYTGLLPIVHENETAKFTNARYVDDKNILQFRHIQENGVLNNHENPGQQISREAFRMFISDVLGDSTSEVFGKCWQFYTETQKALLSDTEKELVCTATLHPEEVKAGLDMTIEADKKLYEGYKKQFNRKFKV